MFARTILKWSLLGIVAGSASAQSTSPDILSSAGAFFQNGSGSIAFTIGEAVIATHGVGNILITQGFHQPINDFSTSMEQVAPAVASGISLFPNPTRDQVVLVVPDLSNGTTYALFDGLGRLILWNTVLTTRTTIDLNDRATGNYFMRLTDVDGLLLETFKLTIAQ